MIRRPPRSTLTDTLVPYTTLFRSVVRAQFPNKGGLLLPGMYVRAEMVEGTRSNGILVPQGAVSRDEKGSATVLVVGAQNKIEMRKLNAPRTVGTNWPDHARSEERRVGTEGVST